MRGLLYEPTYESEVLLLFGLLIPHLKDDFVVDRYFGSFPDCVAKRNGEEVGIEFEVLASDFFDHGHHEDPDLPKCKLLVCWKNDLERKTVVKSGRPILIVNGHEVEIIALKKVVDKLREKGITLIMNGERPDIGEANKERFFKQLEENVDEQKFAWIKELYDKVGRQKEFEVKWSGGKTWFSMRFFAKEWGVDPIAVDGTGKIWLNYTGNPAINPWELPQETKTALQQIFGQKRKRWLTIPLNSQGDMAKIKKALKIIAEHSKRLKLQWQKSE